MPPDSQPSDSRSASHSLPRQTELSALAERLPLRGIEANSKRVFTVWGDQGVGKSSLISAFRESELMAKSKVLWLQPTRDGKVETIPEFIRACAKSIRYPAAPDKESKIASSLESVQRGKVNPIVSDDSILITRSSVAKNKKPYVNQAAASSVGRTEKVQDDIEINVGLGESKATNHAEGFLDALPLQSLGTDLTLIYIDRLDSLSVTIVDWLRDYVFPAATRGAYRRSLALLLEELDPVKLAHPHETWGEWSLLLEDFRVYPLSESDVYQFGTGSGLDPESARLLYVKTHGYPAGLRTHLTELRKAAETNGDKTERLLASLSEEDRLAAAALSLPNKLYPEYLDALFGQGRGQQRLDWLASIPDSPLPPSRDGKAPVLPDAFRKAALAKVAESEAFKSIRSAWIPCARLAHNAPSRSDRSKLLLLASLYWFDESFCQQLFAEKAAKVWDFVVGNPQYFNRRLERYRVSERLRPELRKVAERIGHPGTGPVRKKAETIWAKRKDEIEARAATIEAELKSRQGELNALLRKQKENAALTRIQKRETGGEAPARPEGNVLRSLLSKWFSGAERADSSASPLRQQSHELAQQIQAREARIDALAAELAEAKEILKYGYVEAGAEQAAP